MKPIIDMDRMDPQMAVVFELYVEIMLLAFASRGQLGNSISADVDRAHIIIVQCLQSVNGNRPVRSEAAGHLAYDISDVTQRKALTIAVLRRALSIAEGGE